MNPPRTELIMGMPIEVDVRDADIDDEVLERVFDWFRWVDQIFSTYTDQSEVSRLNSGVSTLEDLNTDVRAVLLRCDELQEETGGYFDVRRLKLPLALTDASGAPVEVGIDPSGYVKGWAVDRAASLLTHAGANNFSVNAGGDVRVSGGALPDRSWRIGIQHPLMLDKVAAVVDSDDLAIATSGEYIRGKHIIDPHTGEPPQDVLSVTVVGPDLGTADAYATAAFAMGDEGPRWTLSLDQYEAMTIMANELVFFTPNFPRLPSTPEPGDA